MSTFWSVTADTLVEAMEFYLPADRAATVDEMEHMLNDLGISVVTK